MGEVVSRLVSGAAEAQGSRAVTALLMRSRKRRGASGVPAPGDPGRGCRPGGFIEHLLGALHVFSFLSAPSPQSPGRSVVEAGSISQQAGLSPAFPAVGLPGRRA